MLRIKLFTPKYLHQRLFLIEISHKYASTGNLLIKKYRQVALIGINRPEKRNALNETLVNELRQAVKNFENDDSVVAAVLYGEGGNFCAGYDLEELNNSEDIPEHFVKNDLTADYVKKPMIAALSGYAVGFGLDLALWCDFRVMDETAVLGCLGRRYGSTMSEFGLARLNMMVGFSRTMDMILTSRSIKCEEAVNFGLINRVVGCGTGRALSIGNDLAKFCQAGLLTDRATLYKHAFARIPLKNSIIDEESLQHRDRVLEDIKEGSQLFTEGAGKHGVLFSQYLWSDRRNKRPV